jgi:hypothetical protein
MMPVYRSDGDRNTERAEPSRLLHGDNSTLSFLQRRSMNAALNHGILKLVIRGLS